MGHGLIESHRQGVGKAWDVWLPRSLGQRPKLFAEAHLEPRVSCFNELDACCGLRRLDAAGVIRGGYLELRIGSIYNSPSSGCCLPKDTKQLLMNYRDVPRTLLSNRGFRPHGDHVVNETLKRANGLVHSSVTMPTVDVYRLTMKSDPGDLLAFLVQGIMKRVKAKEVSAVAHEPTFADETFFGSELTHDFTPPGRCDPIVTNRWDDELSGAAGASSFRSVGLRVVCPSRQAARRGASRSSNRLSLVREEA